jgi:hypothetical protein
MSLLGYRYSGLGAVMAFLNDAGSSFGLPSNSLGAASASLPLPEVNQRHCRMLVPIGSKRETQVAGEDAGGGAERARYASVDSGAHASESWAEFRALPLRHRCGSRA